MKEISLVVPLKNEENTIKALIGSIALQTVLPDEVIMVDGGSSDGTKEIIRESAGKLPFKLKLVETKGAFPGEGRNIGAKESAGGAIAFTDGGIVLDKDWLKELKTTMIETGAEVVYGSYEPVVDSFIKECSIIATVPSREKIFDRSFRTDFIASSLFEKSICEYDGGFPPFRAGEDKVFMDKIKKKPAKIAYTDKAKVYWKIPGTIKAIFKRFREFSAHDILAGRAKDWHTSVFRTYLVIVCFFLLGMILRPVYLLGIVFVWALRMASIFRKKREDFKLKYLFDPRYLFEIMFIVLVTDVALFCGALDFLRMHNEKHN